MNGTIHAAHTQRPDVARLCGRTVEAGYDVAEREREYRAIVWTKDRTISGKTVTIWATSGELARQRIREEFGDDVVCTIWNEDDASKQR